MIEGKVVFFKGQGCGPCLNFAPTWDSFVKGYKGRNVSFEVVEFDIATLSYDESRFPTGLKAYAGTYPSLFFWKIKEWEDAMKGKHIAVPFAFGHYTNSPIKRLDYKDFNEVIKKFLSMTHKEYVPPKLAFKQPEVVVQEVKKEEEVCKKMVKLVGAMKYNR